MLPISAMQITSKKNNRIKSDYNVFIKDIVVALLFILESEKSWFYQLRCKMINFLEPQNNRKILFQLILKVLN